MKNTKHGEVFCCKRLRLLEYLRKEGFMPYATIPEASNPKYYNWLFHNDEKLESAINSYFKNK